MTKCNHNIKSPECSIRFLTHRHMVEENIKYGICPICGKKLEYKIIKELKLNR